MQHYVEPLHKRSAVVPQPRRTDAARAALAPSVQRLQETSQTLNARPEVVAQRTLGDKLSAGAAGRASPLPPGSALRGEKAPIQGAWRFLDDGQNSRVFWLDEGESPVPTGPKPGAWNEYAEAAADAVGPYYVPGEGRPKRGANPALSLGQWTVQYGGSSRAPSDSYNPFGRFEPGGINSFRPSALLPQDRYDEFVAEQGKKDANFQAWDPSGTSALLDILRKKNPDTPVLTSSGYPRYIWTTGGTLLRFQRAIDQGAIYGEPKAAHARAKIDRARVGDPGDLKWAEGVGDEGVKHEYLEASNSMIDEATINSFEGTKRKIQQGEVMGVSAGDAAANAGYDRNEGDGWEWLHLIAHSMGGVEVLGPQVPGNLVAGTSECNTQMIIAEEMIKDIVRKTRGHARLHVYATLSDAKRHIGGRIVYDFLIYDDQGEPVEVYHWTFDCLSRNTPLVAENRQVRQVTRSQFGVGKKGEESKGYSREGFVRSGPELQDERKGAGLLADELSGAVAMMGGERRARIAELLGGEEANSDIATIYDLLSRQPYDVVLDIVRGAMGEPVGDDFGAAVDAALDEYGMVRTPSDSVGFICLIDSIHQLLAADGLGVDRDALIAAVHRETGRGMGDMLEIIGAEGQAVMRAADDVVFATHGRHIRLVANVLMAMPDGSVVPFYRANTYGQNGGPEVNLDLLFVNNNHYEPLFDR